MIECLIVVFTSAFSALAVLGHVLVAAALFDASGGDDERGTAAGASPHPALREALAG